MIRPLGFVLLSLAIVGALLLTANAERFIPGAPLSFNLVDGIAFTIWRTEAVASETDPPSGSADDDEWWLNPGDDDEWRPRIGHLAEPRRVIAFRLSFGNAVAMLAAVGLAGVGLMAYGPKKQ